MARTRRMPRGLTVAVLLLLVLGGLSAGHRARVLAATLSARVTPGTQTATMVSGGLVRSYRLHVPQRLPPAPALVVALHGGGSDGLGMEKLTGYDPLADQAGFLVAYPDGFGKGWADGRGADAADKAHVDDVAFLTALVDRLALTRHVDRRRVFFAGMSNGAFMTERMACDRSGTVAAVLAVAGTLGAQVACRATHPVAVMQVAGTSDPIVPYAGGTMTGRGGKSTIVSAPTVVARWRQLDACTGPPTVHQLPATGDGTTVSVSTTSACGRGTAVSFFTVNGGGHTWPGGPQYLPRAIIGRTTRVFSATAESWRFFQAHPHR
jgi:polyhydroxybutyrate depolymerase